MRDAKLTICDLIKKERVILVIAFIYIFSQIILNLVNTIRHCIDPNENSIINKLSLSAGVCLLIVMMMFRIFLRYLIINYRFRKRVKISDDEAELCTLGLVYIAKVEYLMRHLTHHFHILLGFHLIYLVVFLLSIS